MCCKSSLVELAPHFFCLRVKQSLHDLEVTLLMVLQHSQVQSVELAPIPKGILLANGITNPPVSFGLLSLLIFGEAGAIGIINPPFDAAGITKPSLDAAGITNPLFEVDEVVVLGITNPGEVGVVFDEVDQEKSVPPEFVSVGA